MLIKRQFYFAFAAVVCSLMLALSGMLVMHFRLQRNENIRTWANKVVVEAFNCNVLGTEAILEDNERAREQYGVAAAQLTGLLNSAPESKRLAPMVDRLRGSKKRMDAVLRDFEGKRPPNSNQIREDIELRSMVVSQWMLQTRSALETAQQLRRSAAEHAVRLQMTELAVNMAALALVAFLSGWIFWKSYRTLVTPLGQLSEGARRVGAGDLQHRLPVPDGNEIGQAAESFNRMTEHLSEREAQLNEKMRDLEAFSYSVAHDLKGPLRGVVGFSGLLEAEYKEKLGDEGRGYIERIRDGALRMSSLIDDLLQFGRLTQRHIDITPIYLKDICRETISEMQSEISAAGASVQVAEMDFVVSGNVVLLRQAIANLLGNAMKFVRPGVAPVIQVRARRDDKWTILEIEDNGIGIAEEFHQKIFGLFNRLHDYREYPGTGIGLAIVQKSIERLGGEVEVSSKIGHGATFRLKLVPAVSPPFNPGPGGL